jgi:HK97 family phage major capsid protein
VERDQKGVLSPASYRRIAERKAYDRKAAKGGTVFDQSDQAEAFIGHARLVAAEGRYYAERENDLAAVKAFTSTSPTSGADFIPDEIALPVIRLVEEYGAYRKAHAPQRVTGTDIVQVKRTAGPSLSYPNEGSAATESSSTTGIVRTITKDGYGLTNASLTQIEASAISIADFIAMEFATAMAQDEDEKCLNGDGTSADAGFTGWITAMNAVSSNGMIYSASGNLFSEFTNDDIVGTMSLLPGYVLSSPNCKWLMNSAVYFNPVFRKAIGLGGTTPDTLFNGGTGYQLMGKPVIFAQQMSGTQADTTIFALVGDFSRGAVFGEANGGLQLSLSEHHKWAEGMISWRCRKRWGFTVHAPGTTAIQSGPVAALKSIT